MNILPRTRFNAVSFFTFLYFLKYLHLIWNFGIEALPYSYLIGLIAMLLVEAPLMIRIYKKN